MRRALLVLSSTLIIAAACTRRGSDDAIVPRRTAYPRPAAIDTAMTDTIVSSLRLWVNAGATTRSPRHDWVDIAYPAARATIHITVTHTTPATVAEVRANRLQRLILNEGDRRAERAEWQSAAGYDILVSRTEASATPVQFLATDDSAVVVSGVVYMADPASVLPENTDSMRPMVDAMARDVIATLSRLDHAAH